MFTGLVEELGKVKKIDTSARSVRLTIQAAKVLDDVKIGDSIAVNGACLTVVACTAASFTADVMPETVKQTGLRALKPGDFVNLERALRFGDRLGGHLVSGHIDGIGVIDKLKKDDIAVVMTVQCDAELLRYIVRKGSVAIDGISLTVVEVTDQWFSVSLIPHTYAVTALAVKQPGNMVNVETDLLGRYVEKFLTAPQTKNQGLSKQLLGKYGFLG